jgi:hypothetical protein
MNNNISAVKYICILISCFLLNNILSFGQLDVSVGVTLYDSHNSKLGLNAGASYKNFYLDISSNLKGGKGEIQDYLTNSKTDNVFIFLTNAGYNIPIKKNWYILPVIGIGWKSDIYLHQYGDKNTYSYENARSFLNIGLSAKFFIKEDIGLMMGCGYPEIAKVSFVYKLWN